MTTTSASQPPLPEPLAPAEPAEPTQRAHGPGTQAPSGPATLLRALAATVAGGALALAGWFVMHAVTLPAFNTSMVTRALSAAAGFIVIAIVTLACWVWLRGRQHPVLGGVIALGPAAIVVTSLGIPLSATRLWLDGIQVDQGFRTQFLSRMTETASHADMSYVDLPTFYPMGWFFLGGRLANLLGMPGWEVYQPWALTSLAAAAAALTPIWHKLTGSLPLAAAIAMVTTAVVLTEVPDEPYAAVVALFLPAAVVGAYRALSGSWWASAALAIYLGISASFYTLFTALTALTVVVLALLLAVQRRSWRPVVHLITIGVVSMLIALIAWGPYLYQLLTGGYEARSTANHFLPKEGTVFPLPFFSLSIVGLCCLIGLIYLIARRHRDAAKALTAAIGVCYTWTLASMVITVLGTSLLGFRVEVVLIVLFATAGVLGIAEVRRLGIDHLYPQRFTATTRRALNAGLVVLFGAGTLLYVQQIPVANESHIDQAYADTDGYGERADRFPPDAARHYAEIVDFLSSHGHNPGEAVVYTDEINFMAYTPYYGFNAFTSHYANPLGEFDLRNEALARWAEMSKTAPAELTAAMDTAKWRAPDAFIFRGDLESSDPLKTHIAHDIFPSQPNVRYEGLFFDQDAFASPDWAMKQIGPFVVVART